MDLFRLGVEALETRIKRLWQQRSFNSILRTFLIQKFCFISREKGLVMDVFCEEVIIL